MMFVLFLIVLAAAYVAYRKRVPLLAKILGQPESRIQRQLENRKRR